MGEEESESLFDKLKHAAQQLFDDEDDDGPRLEIIVVCAELDGIFDPMDSVQYPFVEIYKDREEVAETMVACGPDGMASELTSVRPIWNQRFTFRPDGASFYRFRVCIEHKMRNRTIVGEAGFAAADAWRAVFGEQPNPGPIVLSVQLLRRNTVSGILHLILSKDDPKVAEQAEKAARKAMEANAGVEDISPLRDMDARYEEKAWDELDVKERNDWAILGWNQWSWDSDAAPSSEQTSWAKLRPDEQAAANRLGYTQRIWDDRRELLDDVASAAMAQYYRYKWTPDDLVKGCRGSTVHRAHPLAGKDPYPEEGPQPLDDRSPDDPSCKYDEWAQEKPKEAPNNSSASAYYPYWSDYAVARHGQVDAVLVDRASIVSKGKGKGKGGKGDKGWKALSAKEKWSYSQLGWHEAAWEGYAPPPRPIPPEYMTHHQKHAHAHLSSLEEQKGSSLQNATSKEEEQNPTFNERSALPQSTNVGVAEPDFSNFQVPGTARTQQQSRDFWDSVIEDEESEDEHEAQSAMLHGAFHHVVGSGDFTSMQQQRRVVTSN